MTYLVYILTCENRTYVGMTNDFMRRWRQHIGDLKGGAKYTTRFGKDWYPICIIDGFETMKEAMQCEWRVKKTKKSYRGPSGRVRWLNEILETRTHWTTKSPSITSQGLTIYVDDNYSSLVTRDTQELVWV